MHITCMTGSRRSGFDNTMVDSVVEMSLRGVIAHYKSMTISLNKVIDWGLELSKNKINVEILLTQQKEIVQKLTLEKLKIEEYQKAVQLSDTLQ